VIEVFDIYKSFGTPASSDKERVQVLRGVSLQIAPAAVTAIVGPSGAGKSTLLQIIGTLDRPDSGHVTYDGKDVLTMRDNDLSAFRNKNIGFVFQNHRLLPEFSIIENVAMPAVIARTPRRQAFDNARKILSTLGLEHRLDHRPAQLSGGECQRAAVARALVNAPQVILADEPSGSLDSANRRQLHSLFFDICKDFGTTFVIVTHDESLAADAHHVIHLVDGKVL